MKVMNQVKVHQKCLLCKTIKNDSSLNQLNINKVQVGTLSMSSEEHNLENYSNKENVLELTYHLFGTRRNGGTITDP